MVLRVAKISIIIPVYNVERYLKRCIDSIQNQTFADIEILLIDDGSTDSSLDICKKIAKSDERIKVFHKKNGGLSDARNYGLDHATSNLIMFVDPDDWLEVDAIDYLYRLMNKYNTDFAMAENRRMTRYSKVKQPLSVNEFLLSQHDFLEKLFKINTQVNVQYAWAKLYNKKLFQNIRFPVGLTNEDVQTTFEIALNTTKIAYSTKIIYDYFINPNSITTQTFSNKRLDLITIWSNVVKRALTTNNQWIIKNARINYYRSIFGVLTNLAMSTLTLKEKRAFLAKNGWLLKKFNSSYRVLLHSRIPISRKFMIVCYRMNFNFSLIIMSLIGKVIRR